MSPVSEFNEFEPLLKSAKNRFNLSAGLNLEKFNTILSGTNHIGLNSLNSFSVLVIYYHYSQTEIKDNFQN